MWRQSLEVAVDMVRLLEGPRTMPGVRREVVSSSQGQLFWARDNAPACEECLIPLTVSSEDASASARLTSRCLDECSRCSVFNPIKFSNILFERIEFLCSAVDKSIGAEELEALAPQWALCRADFADRVCVDTWDLNRQPAGDLFTTGHNVVCDGPRCCLSACQACLGASTSGWL